MAEAEKVVEVTLKLNEDEARALIALCIICGGDTETTPRKHTAAVVDALQQALGLTWDELPEYRLIQHHSVIWREYKAPEETNG